MTATVGWWKTYPGTAFKYPIGIGLNSFLTNTLILKAYYRYYWDDIGITAHTLSLETPIKIKYQYSLYPFARFYYQTASTYFKPYREHSENETYFTSDYDLSEFWSYKLGIGFGFYPDARFGRSFWAFQSIVFRYAYFIRTEGLDAHMFSLVFNIRKY